MSISPEAMARYRATAERRQRERKASDAARRVRALDVARRAAALLRDDYGATRVLAFGSLAEENGRWFGERSDIDLAAWGMPDIRFYEAVGRLQGVDPEFAIDLVMMERAPERLLSAIDRASLEL